METGLQLGSDLLQVGSQMMDLTWSNKDPSNKAVSIFETVISKVIFRKQNFNQEVLNFFLIRISKLSGSLDLKYGSKINLIKIVYE